jgi:ADP-ribosylglycohydrolase/predicted enzyme related to lactoylglutathione lyase
MEVVMANKSPKIVLYKAVGAMLGAACGDALGWPNESRSRSYVDKSKPQGPLFEFRKWTRRSGGRYYPHEEIIDAGSYSDDTQLILCLARSLQYGSRWWDRFSRVELPFWTLYERGGGGATKRSVDAWTDGVPPWSGKRTTNDVKRYFEAGGNGVAMRILPHVLFNADISEFAPLAQNIMLDGIVTHGHPRALVGALAYGYALWKSIRRTEQLGFGEIVEDLLGNATEWDSIPETSVITEEWIKAASNQVPDYQNLWRSVVQEMIGLLETCKKELSKGALTFDEDALRSLKCFDHNTNGAGTVAAGAAVFLASRYAPDPIHGLRTAAYAIGADTDTIASMTGGLLGTFSGMEWLASLQNHVQDSKYLIKIATDIFSKGESTGIPDTPNVSRSNLIGWFNKLSEMKPGVTCELLDGRRGSVVSKNERLGKTGKFKVVFQRIVCEDGQNLYFSKIKKGTFPPEDSPKLPPASTPTSRAFNFGPKLPVHSLNEAARFYEGILGLNIKKRMEEIIVFEQGLVLVPADYPKSQYGGKKIHSLIYIELIDIERRYELAKSRGVKIISPLALWGNSKRSYFRCSDPDENIVEVFSTETAKKNGE